MCGRYLPEEESALPSMQPTFATSAEITTHPKPQIVKRYTPIYYGISIIVEVENSGVGKSSREGGTMGRMTLTMANAICIWWHYNNNTENHGEVTTNDRLISIKNIFLVRSPKAKK